MNYIVNDMVKTLIEVYKKEELAATVGVSLSTVDRWLKYKSIPRPKQESIIRGLFNEYNQNKGIDNKALDNCLNNLREVFHKTSRYSSRNEALEEISKIFFAHIISILTGGCGITKILLKDEKTAAKNLREFVDIHLEKYCPEIKMIDVSFGLKLKDSEIQLAKEIIMVFDKELGIQNIKDNILGSDILNEIFGKFLSDSFVDEKQLGQYLTPAEIVDFANELLSCDFSAKDLLADDLGYVLDPSCGVGSFLTAFIEKRFIELKNDPGRNRHIKKLIENKIIGIDKSERMFKLALISLSMFGYQGIRLYLNNALAFDDIDLKEQVSVIMTNPPFGAEFPSKEVAGFKIISEWSEKEPKKVNSEILFLEKYIDWLRSKGALLCIVPDSILNNKGIYETLRKGIADKVTIKAVISLPSNTFATTGTETKTSLLYLVKEPYNKNNKTYVSICRNNGYDVITSGAHKTKKYNDSSDLAGILNDYRNKEEKMGKWISGINEYHRWDASYHAAINTELEKWINNNHLVKIKDIAHLASDRFNPLRMEAGSKFNYIEISDVDTKLLRANAKEISCEDAPSRARKLVKKNDIIVSTVRPERGIAAVVNDFQDGFVCTTGFAVLRTSMIEPMVLAYLLQSEFVITQIKKYAMGISYPVIDEKNLLEIYLPITMEQLTQFDQKAELLKQKEREVDELRAEFKSNISNSILIAV